MAGSFTFAILILIALTAWAPACSAADGEERKPARMDEVVVTAPPIIEGNRVSDFGSSSTVVTEEQIADLKQSRQRKDVSLKRPVPLYFVYITAWATEDGIVQFRRDLYQRDGVGAVAAAY